MRGTLRDIEVRVLAELMRNARISDRALAKKLGVSQPTVSRIRSRLEKEGYIRRYTVLPNLRKLGYEIVATTFVKFREEGLSGEEADKLRKRAEQRFMDESFAPMVVMFERGMGLGYTGMIVSYHENYSSYSEFMRMLKQYPVLSQDINSFLLDLSDKVHYRSFSFVPLSHHILALRKIADQNK
jgi:DNA-binding Lrp family transcriptional regulator